VSAKRKIVITGGAGYIGGHLTGLLLENGYQVEVLDKLLFGDVYVRQYQDHPDFTFTLGDVLNIADLARAFRDAYAVIHLAAVVGDPACAKNPELTRLVNVESTKSVVELADIYQVQRLLFASSCSVYGVAPGEVWLNEGSYLNPVSLYAETRIESERIILNGCKHTTPTILRLATVYGYSKRMRFDLAVNIMTLKGITQSKVMVLGGSQYRPFVHCQDVARAFHTMLEAPTETVSREVFNVGNSDQNYRIKDLGRLVAGTLDVEVEIAQEREDDRSYRVDFSKIAWLTGFETIREIPESVLEIKAHFQDGDFKDYGDQCYYNVRYDYML